MQEQWELVCLRLGPYDHLYSEDYFVKELSKVGMSRKGFRAWMTNLGVPMHHIGKYRFVNLLDVSLGLRASARCGPDFFVPGCEAIDKGRASPTEVPKEVWTENQKLILMELFAARKIKGFQNPKILRKSAKAAAERMAAAGFANLVPYTKGKLIRRAKEVLP